MGSGKTLNRVILQEVTDLLYLCGRALSGEPADASRVRRMNLDRVHALAENQGLSAISWYGLESADADAASQGPIGAAWRSERDRAIRRQLLFRAERTQICAQLAESCIWHVPLKGAVLEDWYPRIGMREFSDNDILYDPAYRANIARLFRERGYDMGPGIHDSGLNGAFTKDPIFNFEMHIGLFANITSHVFAQYYEDVHSRLVSEDGSPWRLRFTDEDFFIYLLAHSYKHFNYGGTGARILCDLWVFMKRVGETVDWRYVDGELETLGMTAFWQSLKRLVSCVFEADFDPGELDAGDRKTLYELTAYGVYGTLDHQVEIGLERGAAQGASVGGYMLKRIVPEDEWWEAMHPFAYRHKLARIPIVVYRAVGIAFDPERRKRIATELKVIAQWVKGKRA